MSSILNEIAAYKREWVAACKQRVSEAELVELAATKSPLDFAGALRTKVSNKQNAVIAEVHWILPELFAQKSATNRMP